MKTLTGILCISAMCLSQISLAQSDSNRTFNKGDRNTQITASSRVNVPASQRNQPVQSKYKPNDPGADKPDVLLDVPNLSIDTL